MSSQQPLDDLKDLTSSLLGAVKEFAQLDLKHESQEPPKELCELIEKSWPFVYDMYLRHQCICGSILVDGGFSRYCNAQSHSCICLVSRHCMSIKHDCSCIFSNSCQAGVHKCYCVLKDKCMATVHTKTEKVSGVEKEENNKKIEKEDS